MVVQQPWRPRPPFFCVVPPGRSPEDAKKGPVAAWRRVAAAAPDCSAALGRAPWLPTCPNCTQPWRMTFFAETAPRHSSE